MRVRGGGKSAAEQIPAIISLVVVLPLLPVIATTRIGDRTRVQRARSPRAFSVSGTHTKGCGDACDRMIDDRAGSP